MPTTRRSGWRRWRAGVVALAMLLAACNPGANNERPSDPHQIATDAVRATAALTSVRLHLEAATSIDPRMLGGAGAVGPMQMGASIDADIDLAGRQLAGRQTTTFTGANGLGNGFPNPGPQSNDIIATRDAVFIRAAGASRWTKAGGTGLNGGPTNAAVATALVALLDDARVTYDKADAGSCTLGTCDHVIVHVNGAAVAGALGAVVGVPLDASTAVSMPNVDLDVLIDQKTSIVSEIRTSYAMGGQALQLLVTFANPGDPVQIVAPPPALVDDTLGGFGGGFGGFGFGGGQVTTILETVGSEVEPATPEPVPADPSAP